MKEQEATYDEYLKATQYARWKYKYGLFVLIGCWICFILLIIFMVIYARELSTHPSTYMLEELKANYCYCYSDSMTYYVNMTTIELFG